MRSQPTSNRAPLLALLALLGLLALPAPPAAADEAADAQGLWTGVIFLDRGRQEIEFLVELARDAQGALVGTLDIPLHGLQYQALEEVRQEGRAVSFTFSRFSPRLERTVESPFTGELSEGGDTIEGTYLEGGVNAYPFSLERSGPAGGERPAPRERPVTTLSDDGGELKEAFNADRDRTRVLLLISPTCPVCRMNARIVDRHVADEMPGDGLRLYVVWGPMQHKETEADARAATVTLPDERALHFWTDDHVLAGTFREVLEIPGEEPAWDVYLVYPPGARWGERPPSPAFFMHVEQPLPEEIRFDGVTFADRVREILQGGP